MACDFGVVQKRPQARSAYQMMFYALKGRKEKTWGEQVIVPTKLGKQISQKEELTKFFSYFYEKILKHI